MPGSESTQGDLDSLRYWSDVQRMKGNLNKRNVIKMETVKLDQTVNPTFQAAHQGNPFVRVAQGWTDT